MKIQTTYLTKFSAFATDGTFDFVCSCSETSSLHRSCPRVRFQRQLLETPELPCTMFSVLDPAFVKPELALHSVRK